LTEFERFIGMPHPSQESVAWAALHALDALDADDRRAFEAHLDGGCDSCRAEYHSFRLVAARLVHLVPPIAPPAALRDRLMARIAELAAPAAPAADADTQVWKRWGRQDLVDSLFTLRRDATPWEITAVPGVYVRNLFADPDHHQVTMLVKMDPGTAYPPHRHAGVEECLVLEGDLHVAGRVLHAGDYQRAADESIHGIQSTENGCLLFIVSSTDDELVDG
jgi:anti-sigma factor ChrR (cupin superfamily)